MNEALKQLMMIQEAMAMLDKMQVGVVVDMKEEGGTWVKA